MRVIAGSFKGRRLTAPDTPDTRPATDRVREAVFSALGSVVDGARVLDLYAGSGSFGIEALSRGASAATFVESGRKALDALRRNLGALGVEARVAARPVERFLDQEADGFDLVFCDPPWSMSSMALASVLERLRARLSGGAVVVVSRRAADPVPGPAGYTIDDERRYGDARIIRYRTYETTGT